MTFYPIYDPHPCSFDPQILPNYVLKEQQMKEKGESSSCLLVDAKTEDFDKVERLYNTSKVKGYEIAKIEVIVNKTFSEGFNAMLKIFEERNGQNAFTPTWGSNTTCKEEKEMRQEVFDHLDSFARTPKNFSRVKVIPMFHGTNQSLLPYIF